MKFNKLLFFCRSSFLQSPDIRSPRIAGVLLDIEVELKSDGLEDEYPRVSKDMDESYSLRISYDHPQRTITAK